MTIHVGLIGGGNISGTHARAACTIPGVAIAAVYGTNTEKVARLCNTYGGRPYTDLEHFLSHRPMDLVAIGSPSGVHAEQGIAAARHHLHVLTEKPIDIRTERADALIAEAERAGIELGVFYQDRFKPEIRRMKDLVEAGALGRAILADAQVKWYRAPEYYTDSDWHGKLELDGGGALINQGIHTVDVLLWLLGDVTRVQARMSTALHSMEGEDTIVALLEFASGALGMLLAATSAYPGYPRRIELTGSEGTLMLEGDRLVRADLRRPRPDVSSGIPVREPIENASLPTVSDASAHRAVLEDFIRAIQNNTAPACSGREARRSLALVEAIYAAARAGTTVNVG
jgi:predicted dehydrogenase